MPMFLYLTVAYAGYVSFGQNTPDFVLFRPAMNDSKDLMMTFVQLGVICSLILGITLRIIGITDNFIELIKKPGEEENIKLKRIFMLIIALSCYFFSLFVKKLLSVISLFSSLLCPVFIIICPAILSIKLRDKLKIGRAQIVFIYLQLIVFLMFLGISIVKNLMDFFNNKDIVG